MKNNVTLSIPNPCSEKWESFSMTSNGAFCSTCSKKVVDFTKMGDSETLVFSFIGFDTKEYIIPKEVPAKIEIHMSTAYIEMMGAVAVDEVYEPKQTDISKLWTKVKSIF
jgi:hypothetical protein